MPGPVNHRPNRHRRSRHGAKRQKPPILTPRQWIRARWKGITTALLFFVALYIWIDPLSMLAVKAEEWAAGSDVRHTGLSLTLVLGNTITALVVAVGLTHVRGRAVASPRLWSDHCPACQRSDLVRVHRSWIQRLPAVAGIPARRYRCRSCQWEGLRISHRARKTHWSD